MKFGNLKSRASSAYRKGKSGTQDIGIGGMHHSGGATSFGELLVYLLILGCFGVISGVMSFLGALESVAGETILVIGMGSMILAIFLGKSNRGEDKYSGFELGAAAIVIIMFLVNYDTIAIPTFLESITDYIYKTWKAFGIVAVSSLIAIFED